jgi:hypothetical protein
MDVETTTEDYLLAASGGSVDGCGLAFDSGHRKLMLKVVRP